MGGFVSHLIRVILAIGLVALILFASLFYVYMDRIFVEDEVDESLNRGIALIAVISIAIGMLFCILDHHYRKTAHKLRNAEMYYDQLHAKMETEMAYSEIFSKINELTEVFSNTHDLEAVLNEAASTLKQVLNASILTLQILVEIATQSNIQQLHPTADTQRWDLFLQGPAGQGQL